MTDFGKRRPMRNRDGGVDRWLHPWRLLIFSYMGISEATHEHFYCVSIPVGASRSRDHPNLNGRLQSGLSIISWLSIAYLDAFRHDGMQDTIFVLEIARASRTGAY